MLNTQTSVLARRVRITSDYTTLPYEAGWASEAVFFTQVEGRHPDLTVSTEISPDGITWIPHGESRSLPEGEQAMATGLTVFGTWLRLRINGASELKPARILVHLNLKG